MTEIIRQCPEWSCARCGASLLTGAVTARPGRAA